MTDAEMASAVHRVKNGMLNAQVAMGLAQTRIHELETALNRMILAHENLQADTDGRYPPADCGCIYCTAGCVPDKLNTGPCALHNAKALLGQL